MRIDKYLKVSRLIKRRTVANEVADAGRILVNGKPAKASYAVKEGDVIEITFGNKPVKVRVLSTLAPAGKDVARRRPSRARRRRPLGRNPEPVGRPRRCGQPRIAGHLSGGAVHGRRACMAGRPQHQPGCHPRDCHYSEGNYYARRRLETLKEFLPIIGIDPRRFEYTWVSASEGQRWQAVVTAFTERVHKLGPAPKFEDAKPMYVMPNLDLPAPLRPLGCGVNPAAMTELKDQIKAALEAKEVEFVMGWQKGFDGLHATPLYMRKPEDVEKLIWGPLNVHSLATYLPLFKGKKVGIVVKGCDSRGVVELLQENLINREDVVVFGMGCNGTIDINRVLAKIGDVTEVESVTAATRTSNGSGRTSTPTSSLTT